MSDGPMAIAEWWLTLPVALTAADISAVSIRLIRPKRLSAVAAFQ
jgi:hypothetical protein